MTEVAAIAPNVYHAPTSHGRASTPRLFITAVSRRATASGRACNDDLPDSGRVDDVDAVVHGLQYPRLVVVAGSVELLNQTRGPRGHDENCPSTAEPFDGHARRAAVL